MGAAEFIVTKTLFHGMRNACDWFGRNTCKSVFGMLTEFQQKKKVFSIEWSNLLHAYCEVYN